MRRGGGKSKGEDYDYDYDWYIILLAKIADKIWSAKENILYYIHKHREKNGGVML